MHALIVGGGIFGVTAALELCQRRHYVTLCDPGPLPHPLAESTDISKVVRCDYGDDVLYTELGERALEGWRSWNAELGALFHETGVAFVSRSPMQPGGFEHDSFALLSQRGHRIERLDAREIARRFPAYRPGAFIDGYFHAEGGWVQSGNVVSRLVAKLGASGATIRKAPVDRLVDGGALVLGEKLEADVTIVCAGSWTQRLLPELAGSLRAVGQPVFHFLPADPSRFEAARFPVFGADISQTGYYGFPLASGVVKIANHGVGREIVPAERAEVDVTQAELEHVRAFVRDTFPALANAPITNTRTCVYGDSIDGHFWIDRHPRRSDLIVAAGGSGHAFKFAPVLGALIADAATGKTVQRFRWRPELATHSKGDAARSDHQ